MDNVLNPQQVSHINKSFNELLSSALRQLEAHCFKLYTKDTKFECLRPSKSFWTEGGTDPLDYIYIFRNPGNPSHGVPRHWHYIGFGLSDIAGYTFFRYEHERLREIHPIYEKSTQPMPELYPQLPGVQMSGFGFELTARVKCNSDLEWNSKPPLWPSRLMQDLAKYVYQSKNTFSVGDHVAWHSPLDGSNSDRGGQQSASRIEHILMTLDQQLCNVTTQFGSVKFIQIVGVCKEELEAARRWNVRGILKMMKEREDTGGPQLVTDMRRGATIFELDPSKYEKLECATRETGSDMAQISSRHKASYRKPEWFIRVESGLPDHQEAPNPRGNAGGGCSDDIFESVIAEVEAIKLVDEQQGDADSPGRIPSRMSIGSESALRLENAIDTEARYHETIYILLNYGSARVLPVMLQDRLAHKKPFSFQSFNGDSLITFQPEGSPIPSLVDSERPFARKGHWLQIYVSDALREQMYESVKTDYDPLTNQQPRLPKNYSWPEFNLHLTVVIEI